MNRPTALRRLARWLEENPDPPRRSAEIAALQLIDAGLVLHAQGHEALIRAKQDAARGYPSGGDSEGRGKGGHADPTATVALSSDPFTQARERILSVVGRPKGAGQAELMCRGVVADIRWILQEAPSKGLRTPMSDECAGSPLCRESAVKSGRCNACYLWCRDHRTDADPWPIVPAGVIEERQIRRRYAAKEQGGSDGPGADIRNPAA